MFQPQTGHHQVLSDNIIEKGPVTEYLLMKVQKMRTRMNLAVSVSCREQRSGNTLYQELSFQDAEALGEMDEGADITGICYVTLFGMIHRNSNIKIKNVGKVVIVIKYKAAKKCAYNFRHTTTLLCRLTIRPELARTVLVF
jgi:hypothetical protein